MMNLRTDLSLHVELLPETFEPLKDFDPAQYQDRTPGMYPGKETYVCMRCHERILNTLVDFLAACPSTRSPTARDSPRSPCPLPPRASSSLPCNTPTTWSCWSLNGCGKNQRYLDPECRKICWLIKFKPCEVLPWPITIEGGIGHENQESQSQSSLDNLFETLFNPTLYTLEEMPDCPRTYNRRTPVPCLAALLSFIGSAPNKPNDPCYNMQQHHIHSKSQKAWLCL